MFRPCIDLHEGKVKQIVGGTLGAEAGRLQTNFVSQHPAAWYAELYKRDGLKGGHIIMLGPGNDEQAEAALEAYPGGMQLGGGVNLNNARDWLDSGASHVIVTSWVFPEGVVDWERLKQLSQKIGKQRLVLDLSCRKREEAYFVVTNRWQKCTELMLNPEILAQFAEWCGEFLVHAVDVEGLCKGIDEKLVSLLAGDSPIPTTYAGGARSLDDLEKVTRLSKGRVDLTAVAFNRKNA